MGCNCNKGRAGRRTAPSREPRVFEVLTASGTREKYGSRLEAEAANVRDGGTGTVRRIS